MTQLHTDPYALKKLEHFTLPRELGFGKHMMPIMIEANFDDGQWSDLHLREYGPLELDPTTKVLHYGQEIFEGLKAYKTPGESPRLFRPDQNAERFNASAERMAMAPLPSGYFLKSVRAIVHYCEKFIPTRTGESLYLRPFMIATETHVGIKPSSSFKYLVVATPVGSYFKGNSVKVYVEDHYKRAASGGIGAAKTGGNYAAALLASQKAFQKGYDQVLWLDAKESRYIEELSGMNFMAVINDTLVTPPVSETILEGITRKSILELAGHRGLKVEERPLEINQLCQQIESGECTEAFCCGTAAILTPIKSLTTSAGKTFELRFSDGQWASMLRQKLLEIQEGKAQDPFDWVTQVTHP